MADREAVQPFHLRGGRGQRRVLRLRRAVEDERCAEHHRAASLLSSDHAGRPVADRPCAANRGHRPAGGADRFVSHQITSQPPAVGLCSGDVRVSGLLGLRRTAILTVSSGCIAGVMQKPWSNLGGLSITSQSNCGAASASSPGLNHTAKPNSCQGSESRMTRQLWPDVWAKANLALMCRPRGRRGDRVQFRWRRRCMDHADAARRQRAHDGRWPRSLSPVRHQEVCQVKPAGRRRPAGDRRESFHRCGRAERRATPARG